MPRNNSNQADDALASIEHERPESRPDFTQPLPRQRLPTALQETLDSEEKWWDTVASGKGQDSTDSSLRYAAYANRLRTIMLSAHRYVAYTSDVGESFRPVAHPWLVRGAYGVSWAYLVGDVGYEGYKAYTRNQQALHPTAAAADPSLPAADTVQPEQNLVAPVTGKVAPIDHWGTVMAQRAVFQSVASMGLPAFTIHSIVRYSGRALKDVKNVRIRTWGPIGLGLAAVPALPFMFDKPVEHATEWIFHKGFELVGGPEAVGHRPAEETVAKAPGKTREGTGKEKEL